MVIFTLGFIDIYTKEVKFDCRYVNGANTWCKLCISPFSLKPGKWLIAIILLVPQIRAFYELLEWEIGVLMQEKMAQ